MRRKLFQLIEGRQEDFSAWNKAPADIAVILKNLGCGSITLAVPLTRRWRGGVLVCFFRRVVAYVRALLALERESVLLIQFPPAYWGRVFLWEVLSFGILKKVRLAILLHDVNGLRDGDGLALNEDKSNSQKVLLQHAYRIIVHNDVMRQWLVGKGFPPEKIIPLGIFDYLMANGFAESKPRYDHRLVVAGNLSPTVTGFLCELKKISQITWELYGSGYDAEKMVGARVDYRGVANADDLPGMLHQGFGLIWYGHTLDTCGGRLRDYLRIINPHKLSLYLAAGLPVVVWDQMAIAEFVRANDVGIAVSSVYDAARIICEMTPVEYDRMSLNARRIGRELRAGLYTRHVMEQINGQ